MPYTSKISATTRVEVRDLKNRPLCELALEDILRQRLPHRACAVLAMDSQYLLVKQAPGPLFCATCFGPVFAGKSSPESAELMLGEMITHRLPDYPDLILPGYSITGSCTLIAIDVFIARTSLSIMRAWRQPEFPMLHISEIPGLAQIDMLHGLLKNILTQLNLIG